MEEHNLIENNDVLYFIDVTIVTDSNINTAYSDKINKCVELEKYIYGNVGAKSVKIIPVVLSINGLINQLSLVDLAEFGLNIDWENIVRTVIIRNMQDIMTYFNNAVEC